MDTQIETHLLQAANEVQAAKECWLLRKHGMTIEQAMQAPATWQRTMQRQWTDYLDGLRITAAR